MIHEWMFIYTLEDDWWLRWNGRCRQQLIRIKQKWKPPNHQIMSNGIIPNLMQINTNFFTYSSLAEVVKMLEKNLVEDEFDRVIHRNHLINDAVKQMDRPFFKLSKRIVVSVAVVYMYACIRLFCISASPLFFMNACIFSYIVCLGWICRWRWSWHWRIN